MDKRLITIDEVRNFGRQLSKNIDDLKFETMVLEAQRNFLEPLIGSALYVDLLQETENLDSGDLVNSTLYKITQYNTSKSATDDFINVGALLNQFGETFTSTGTTPTSWTLKSILQSTSSIYFDLLNGKRYYNSSNELVNFRGVKLFLIYHFLYLYTKEADYQYSDEGGKQYLARNSEQANNNFNRDIIYQHKKNADLLGKQILTFLEDNKDLYPIYKSKNTKPEAAEGIDFTIMGTTYRRSPIIE